MIAHCDKASTLVLFAASGEHCCPIEPFMSYVLVWERRGVVKTSGGRSAARNEPQAGFLFGAND